MDYFLSATSTLDLSKEYIDKIGIKVIYNIIELDESSVIDDLGKTLIYDDFYNRLKNGSKVTTSQINITRYIDYFREMLDQGKDIVHLELSSGLAGAYNAAYMAALEIKDEYPNNEIYIIDTLNASTAIGAMLDKLSELRDEGYKAKDAKNWIEENRDYFQTWAYCSDLTQYVKGGRISKASGYVGGLLNINPILTMTLDGHLVVHDKVRTNKKRRKYLVDKIKEFCKDGENYDGKIFISHSSIEKDALLLKEDIEKTFPKVKDILINYIGTTIGAHTGQGTVGVFFLGDKKKEAN